MAGPEQLRYAETVVVRLRLFVRMASSSMARSPAATMLTIAIMSVALAILGAFAVAHSAVGRMVEEAALALEVSIYLEPEVDAEVFARHLRNRHEVSGLRLVSSDDAMRAFEAQLGARALLLDGLPPGVIPQSIEVELSPAGRELETLRTFASWLATLEGVQDVSWSDDRLEELQFVRSFVQTTFGVLGTALGFAVTLIVANTVRLTVLARKDELEVLQLVGGTRMFIGAPFMLEGLFAGVSSGLFATAWLAVLNEALASALARILPGVTSRPFELWVWGPWLVSVGAALGLLGAGFAVMRFLRR